MDAESAGLGEFLAEFNKETDRGAVLIASSILDDWLRTILLAFLSDNQTSKGLLDGPFAPLGTFAARAQAAHALCLIQDNEFEEITIVRKVRNEFGHKWKGVRLDSPSVAAAISRLPWLGPPELEPDSTLRQRFNFALAILLTDLMWRSRLVAKEKRHAKQWPNKTRHT